MIVGSIKIDETEDYVRLTIDVSPSSKLRGYDQYEADGESFEEALENLLIDIQYENNI